MDGVAASGWAGRSAVYIYLVICSCSMGRISVLGWLGTLAHALIQTPIFDYTSIENIENKEKAHMLKEKESKDTHEYCYSMHYLLLWNYL